MRGDSVRDFYAKTIALLGLGALAGTGALVDYWPTRITLPNVPSVTIAVLAPAGSAALAVPENTPAFVVASVRPQPVVPSPVAVPSLPVTIIEPVSTLTQNEVALTAPSLAIATAEGAFGDEVAISEPEIEAVALAAATPVPAVSPRTDGGILASTFRPIGDSLAPIGSTLASFGAKTGSSVASLGRVFGRVGKKVLKAFPII